MSSVDLLEEELDVIGMEFEKNAQARASTHSTPSVSSMEHPETDFRFDPDNKDCFRDEDSPVDEVSMMARFKLRSLSIPFRNKARTRASTRSTRSTSSMDPPDETFGTDPDEMDRMDSESSCSMEKPLSVTGNILEDPTRPRSPAHSYSTMQTERSARASPLVPVAEPESGGPYVEAGDVACGVCRGRKMRACKSCLTCMRSFCHVHVKDHYVQKIMRSHQLVEATEDLSVYREITKLKQINTDMREENIKLREELDQLRQYSDTAPKLPDQICKGRMPTAADVILDQGSAHPALILSHDGKRVKFGEKSPVSSTPHRFNRWECVSATEGFSSGRHYWEVEVNKEFTIGVMKQFAPRLGRFTFTPSQGYWCLFHYWLSFTALNEPTQRLPNSAVPRLLGVCVDVDEKWVTFYNAETKDLIYSFTNMKLAHREKVYPVFRTLEKSVALQIKSPR